MIRHEQPVLYTADLTGCTQLTGARPEDIATAFTAVLQSAGATVVQEVSHLYPGAGLTCVLVLRESHAVLHTWPETGTINVDVFSCSTRLKSLAAIEELGRIFGASNVSIQEMARADGHRVPSAEHTGR